jgi:hypothetical protein
MNKRSIDGAILRKIKKYTDLIIRAKILREQGELKTDMDEYNWLTSHGFDLKESKRLEKVAKQRAKQLETGL